MARQSEAATVIYAIRTHGAARLQRLTPWRVSREDPDPPLVTSPAWSRDSRSIAFSRYFRGAPRIYVVGANGGHLRQVARGELPTWSPREGRLAFIASARKPNEIGTGIPIGIGLVKPGSRPRVIANSPGSEWIVTWTRDGNELVFAAGNWIYIAQSGIPTRRPTATDRSLLRLVPTPDQSWSDACSCRAGLNARTAGVYLRADPSDLQALDGGSEEERAELIAQRLREWKSAANVF